MEARVVLPWFYDRRFHGEESAQHEIRAVGNLQASMRLAERDKNISPGAHLPAKVAVGRVNLDAAFLKP